MGFGELEDLGDGRPALVAGGVAFGTALGLVEDGVGVPGRVEPRLGQLGGAVTDGELAEGQRHRTRRWARMQLSAEMKL